MHLLTTSSTNLDEIVEAVDLGQTPGDIVMLSFADSDLASLAAAWEAERAALPRVRLAHLRDLRHPMSVDLWIDRVATHAKVIVIRLLGGLEWWKYGIERLSVLARERGIALAVLPGEDRDDGRLAAASTLPPQELGELLGYFREGGRENLRALLRRLAGHAGFALEARAPAPVPRLAGYLPGEGTVALDRLVASLALNRSKRPVVPILFYRALLLAADTAPIDALCAALAERDVAPAPLVVTSLKDPEAAAFLRDAFARLDPAVIVTTTAFAAGNGGEPTSLDAAGVPVLQVVSATTRRAAWSASARGLGAADLAMHIVLPELDGRVLAGAVAFKNALPAQEGLAFTALASRPEADRIAMVAGRIVALARLQALPRGKRRIAVLMPDYPGAPGRTGYAVGLDVPASVLALANDLAAAGYSTQAVPKTPRDLLDALADGAQDATLAVARYENLLQGLPAATRARLLEAWGEPANDPDVHDGAFHFRARAFGKLWIALPPDRGRASERRADYHDPALPPRHALVAFGLWLRHVAFVDALVHMGAHGTLEWLPGKAVALTAECFPEIVTGSLPVIYPFIVSNPGEAAQAKRRIAAVTIGHLPPPLAAGGLFGDARELERLVDEYAQADGLDPRRRERLGRLIVDTAQRTGLARAAGVQPAAAPGDALRRIDAWLCDLKDLAVKDGLHIYGRAADGDDPLRQASAETERNAVLAALDGRRVAPGPAGSPTRGRRDVLPTGRNLFTADPRALPTPTAMDLGRLAADEVLRAHLQTHGEPPRSVVIDLWGSATLRTGGEEIAQGLALLGCRPIWDHASGRVTGVEVLPNAAIGRARVDVTWRISGLFRDLFPAQIALIDAAVQAVAARQETDDENPLAAARRVAGSTRLDRIFGTAPGTYGSGIEDLLGRGTGSETIGAAYLAAASHSYGGAEGDGGTAPGAFTQRVAEADLLVHSGDDPARDLLEGAEDAAFVGGFAAAAKMLGRAADLVMLDTTDPQRPRARTLSAALERIVRARAVNPRFIAGMMRHGPRGAAELAETVDRLAAFAETTDAVASGLFDLLHDAYVADPGVSAFLLRENPRAAAAIADRFEAMRRAGLWHPHRNDIDAGLAMLRGGSRMTALAIDRPLRRGVCPGLTTPMQTGDGLLVRLMPAGTISPAALMRLCEAARAYGNGVIEVTGRGSIQLRGLTAVSAPALADAVAALGIAAADGVAVITNSLAGLAEDEILDAGAVAADLRHALSRTSLAARLAPKISVAIDGGGAHGTDHIPADIRLDAAMIRGEIALRLSIGGDDADTAFVGSIAPADAVEATIRLLEVLAACGRDARARDVLKAGGLEPFRAALGGIRAVSESGPDSRIRGHGRKADAIGLHRLRDRTLARGVGLAFGHADAATLECLAETADALRAAGIRAGAGRVLMIVGLTEDNAAAFMASAKRLGFIVRANDPRRRVIACAGAPVCSSAHIAARTLAPRVAELVASGHDDTRIVHISGCAKGCAHSGKAALTVVGRPDGCALVVNGSARDAPGASVAFGEILGAIAMHEGRHV